jgi:hypothetical protein
MSTVTIDAIALRAGDHVKVRLPDPSRRQRLSLRLRGHRPVTEFPAVIRAIEIREDGGVADCESLEIPGLFASVPFRNGDLAERLAEAGWAA